MSPGVPEPFSPPWPDYKVDPGSDIHSNISPHLTEGTRGNIVLNRDRKPELWIQVDFEFPQSVVESSNSKCCVNTREILLCKRQAGFSTDWRPGVRTSLVLKCGTLWDSEAPVTFAPRITLPCQACYHSRCPFDIRIYHQRRISRIFYRIYFRSMVYSLPVW